MQSHQERSYQEYLATKAVERAQQQEAYYDQLMASHQSEVAALRNQVISLKRDLENIKTRYNETSEKLMEKSRQYQKLQVGRFNIGSWFHQLLDVKVRVILSLSFSLSLSLTHTLISLLGSIRSS